MRWNVRDSMDNDRQRRFSDWHRWFALFPVKIRAEWVWFEFVERKNGTYPHKIKIWHYRNRTS